MSQIYWKIDDELWMSTRKAEWAFVKNRLLSMMHGDTGICKDTLPNYEELYLYGTLKGHPIFVNGEINSLLNGPGFLTNTNEERALNFNQAYDTSNWALILIWFHPFPDTIDLYALLKESLNTSANITNLRDALKFGFFPSTVEYGMMAGHEKYAAVFIAPVLEYNKEITLQPKYGGNLQKHSIGSASLNLQTIVNGHTTNELCMDARFMPYGIGQFYWINLSHLMETVPEKIFFRLKDRNELIKHKNYNMLKRTVAEIINFENRSDKSSRRPSTIEMVNNLIQTYDDKAFEDSMMRLWNDAKKSMKKLLKKNDDRFFLAPDVLNGPNYCQGNFPPEDQAELVSKWKQV